MAKLQNIDDRHCEYDFENAFITYLEEEGWQFLLGGSIPCSSQKNVLYTDDMEQICTMLKCPFWIIVFKR